VGQSTTQTGCEPFNDWGWVIKEANLETNRLCVRAKLFDIDKEDCASYAYTYAYEAFKNKYDASKSNYKTFFSRYIHWGAKEYIRNRFKTLKLFPEVEEYNDFTTSSALFDDCIEINDTLYTEIVKRNLMKTIATFSKEEKYVLDKVLNNEHVPTTAVPAYKVEHMFNSCIKKLYEVYKAS